MRVFCSATLVAIAAGGFQSTPVIKEVAVIVDSDGPVANAEASARLRARALAQVERYGRPVYFNLTADSIDRVPENASNGFRSATFTFQPPTYAGVSLSFDEASEMLRKNEALRDAIIRRECSTSPAHGCGGAVHAAARTLVADTEGASAGKLRHLVETATSRRAALLILVRRKFSASGTSFSTVAARRQLDSELLFVWLPWDATWITVRDVIAIDGKPRPAADRRLQPLLSGQAVSVDQLKQLATENGRFNIGRILRTFNEPTLALLFLDEHYRHRFTFARGGDQTIDDQRAATYDFFERATPTVIQDQDRDVPTRGTLWIHTTTGRVLQTSLELSDSSGRLRGRMTVQYGANARFDVLVPLEMRETYTSLSGEEVTTVATYSDFRRFEAAGRLILPK